MGYFNRNGIHWADTPNVKLRDLARESAERYERGIEYDEDYSPEIEVVFGSTGSTVKLRSYGADAVNLYSYGYCTFLALAIHDLTGFPLVLFTSQTSNGEAWSGHAAVQVGEDAYLDIRGVRSVSEIMKDYGELSQPEIIGSKVFQARVADAEWKHDLWSFVEELERLVTEDFAIFVVEDNFKTVEMAKDLAKKLDLGFIIG